MNISEPHVKIPLIIGAATIGVCWMLVSDIKTVATPEPAPVAAASEPASDSQLETINDLQTRVIRLQGQIARLSTRYDTAVFDPSEETFQRIDSDMASFAVSLTNLQPYGDGSRITVKLGNPLAASFANVKLKVKYGLRSPDFNDPKFSEKLAEVQAQTKTKEVTLTKNVVGGSWNPNQIVLPGIKPDVLGFIEIAVETDAIFLTQN